MKNEHTFEIDSHGNTGSIGTTLKMDGGDISEGITRIGFDIDSHTVNVLSVEIVGSVLMRLAGELSMKAVPPESVPLAVGEIMGTALVESGVLSAEAAQGVGDPAIQAAGTRFLELLIEHSGPDAVGR